MADSKELGISVTATIDDVTSSLQSLLDQLGSIPDALSIDLSLSNYDTIESQINSIQSGIESLSGTGATVAIEATDNASDDISNIESELTALDGETATVNIEGSDNVNNLNQDLSKTSDKADDATTSGGGLGGVITTIVTGIGALDVNSRNMQIEKDLEKATYYGNGTHEMYMQLKQDVIDLSSGIVPIEDIAASEKDLARSYSLRGLGIEDVRTTLPDLVTFAKTTGMNTDVVTKDMARMGTQYGWTADQVVSETKRMNTASLLLQSSTPSDFMAAINKSTQTLGALGYSADEVTNLLGAFDRSGIDASTAASSLTMATNQFNKALKESEVTNAEKDINKLGIATRDSNGHLRDKHDILIDVTEALGSMDDATFKSTTGMSKLDFSQELFGARSAKVWAQLKESPSEYAAEIDNNYGKVIKANAKINKDNQSTTNQIKDYWQDWIASLDPMWAKFIGFVGAVGLGVGILEGIFRKAFGTSFVGSMSKWISGTDLYANFKKEWDSFVSQARGRASTFWDDIFGKGGKSPTGTGDAGKLPGETGAKGPSTIEMVQGADETWETEKTRFGSYIEFIKSRIETLKGSNIWKILFGDEKGTVKLPDINIGGWVTDTLTKLKTVNIGGITGGISDMIFGGIKTAFQFGGWAGVRNAFATGFIKALTFGAADFGLLGLDLPGNPIWNLTHNIPLIDTKPLEYVKTQIVNALKWDTSEKGSLADQLNFPGWLRGQIEQPIADLVVWIINSGTDLYNSAKNAMGQLGKGIEDSGAYQYLKKIYCIIAGCSPGIIPALYDMGSASGVMAASLVADQNTVRSSINDNVNEIGKFNSGIQDTTTKVSDLKDAASGVNAGGYQVSGAGLSPANYSDIGGAQTGVRDMVANPDAYFKEAHTDYLNKYYESTAKWGYGGTGGAPQGGSLAGWVQGAINLANNPTLGPEGVHRTNVDYMQKAYGIALNNTFDGVPGVTTLPVGGSIDAIGNQMMANFGGLINWQGMGGSMDAIGNQMMANFGSLTGLSFPGLVDSRSTGGSASSPHLPASVWASASSGATTHKEVTGQSVTININGDVKIRDDMDIKKIATEVGKQVDKQAQNGGVHTVNGLR
jgi:hypothetical protein